MSAPTGTEFTLTPEEEAALGDPGKAAIDRMKAAQKESNARAASAEAELAKLRAPKVEPVAPAPHVEPSSAQTVDVASLVKAEADKIRADALREKAGDKLEAKAAKLLADPADAARYLKVDDYVVNGVVDLAAMDAALVELVKSKPYLKSGDDKPHFEGGADGGPKENAGKPQISRAEVERLAASGAHAKIEEFRLAGQLDNIMGIKR